MEHEVPLLVELFLKSSSSSSEDVKYAEIQLQSLTRNHGFFLALTKMVVNPQYNRPVRLPAVIFLKNNLEKVWTRASRNPDQFLISEDEKAHIRATLLSVFSEPDDLINAQIGLTINRLARIDSIQHWPQLIPTLTNAILNTEGDTLAHNRALGIFYQTIKALTSKRLPADKLLFKEISSSIFNLVVMLWKSHLDIFTSRTNSTASAAHASSGLICLKVLRYVLNYGFAERYDTFDVQLFMNDFPTHFRRTVDALLENPTDNEALRRVVKTTLKIILEFLELHPSGMIPWLYQWLDACAYTVFHDKIYSMELPQIKLRALVFLKLVLDCNKYKMSSDAKNSEAQARSILESFFSNDRVQNICYSLIKHYFTLNEDCLKKWTEEPENFASETDCHCWREYLPSAAEHLFTKLAHTYWSYLNRSIPEWMAHIVDPIDSNSSAAVLEKDALLLALGLIANDLYEEINFDALFNNYFAPFLSSPCDGSLWNNLIRRRILWTCGQWVSVKFCASNRHALYRLLLEHMDAKFDIVIRVTACQTFRTSVNDFEFSLDDFKPFIQTSVTMLVALLKSCKETETQTVVLHTLFVLISRLGKEVKHYLEPILSQASLLWTTGNVVLKNFILSLFTEVVKVMKADCTKILRSMCLILPFTLDTCQESQACLTEDGLDLLEALVQNSSVPFPSCLLDLTKYLPDLIVSQNKYNIVTACSVVEACCATQMPEFLEAYYTKFCAAIVDVINELNREERTTLLKVAVSSIRAYKSDGCLASAGIIEWCIRALDPSKNESVPVLLEACSILALTSMYNMDVIFNILKPFDDQKGLSFLRSWISYFNLTSNSIMKQKLFALGLCSWLTLPALHIVEVFPDIFLLLVDTLRQVSPSDDFACTDKSETPDDESSNEHDKRLRSVRRQDPLYTKPLREIVHESLTTFERVCQSRGQRVDELWSKFDASLLNEYKTLMSS